MQKVNKIKVLQLALFVQLWSLGVVGAEYAPNIGIDESFDLYVRRLVSKYDVAFPGDMFVKPYTAAQALQFLENVDSLHSLGRLSAQEAFFLPRIRKQITGENKLFSWYEPSRKAQTHLGISLIGDMTPSIDDSDVSFNGRGIIRPEFTAAIGNFSFYSQLDVWTEVRNDTTFRVSSYQPFEGLSYNLYGRADSGHVRASDIFRGGVVFRKPFFELSAAVDYLRQGPAVFNPLTFSGFAPPVTYVRASIDFASFSYFQTVAQLRTQKDKNKFLYTHRLQFGLFKERAVIGINEVIINGSTAEKAQTDSLRHEYYGQERDLEWVYLIPFVPYSFAEHYVGDMDNAAISFDISVQLPFASRAYGELFFDDISNPLTILSDDWGNKWAATIGLEHFAMIKGKDVHAIVEYSRVEPWVYTHFYGGSHRYTHYGRGLGAALGPNSDMVVFRVDAALHNRHTIGLQLESSRKNGRVRGGNIRDVFQDEVDSEKKKFLGSGTDRKTAVGLLWQLNEYGRFRAQSLLEVNTEKEVSLEVYGGFYF